MRAVRDFIILIKAFENVLRILMTVSWSRIFVYDTVKFRPALFVKLSIKKYF